MTFSQDGFSVIRNLITEEESNNLRLHLINREKNGTQGKDYIITCDQAIGSPSFYGDDVMKNTQIKLLPDIEKHSELELYKTYSYARIYKKGDILKIHKDRAACEISVTIDLGGDKWPIWLVDENGNSVEVNLNLGDALLYKGCDLFHWRKKFDGDKHSQIFIHYVDQNGKNAWAKDDERK
jgi:hypothetical protein